MTKWKNLTPAEFKKIKALLDAGVSRIQVSKIMERSTATVTMISRAGSFDEYLDIVRSYYKTKSVAKQEEEAKVEETIDEVNAAKRVVLHTHEGTEATSLNRIANALERLADAWEASPKKKFF